MTYNEVRADENIRVYIAESDRTLAELGFTEHSFAHVTAVAEKPDISLKQWDIRCGRWNWPRLPGICMTSGIW